MLFMLYMHQAAALATRGHEHLLRMHAFVAIACASTQMSGSLVFLVAGAASELHCTRLQVCL